MTPTEELSAVASMLAEKCGLRVVFAGNMCATNGRTIYLPVLPPDASPDLVGAIRGFLDHEVGHIVGDSKKEVYEAFMKTGRCVDWLNGLDDLRVERVMCDKFCGSILNLETAMEAIMKMLGSTEKPPRMRQAINALYLKGKGIPPPASYDADVIKWCDDNRDFAEEARDAASVEEVASVAERAANAWTEDEQKKEDERKKSEPKQEEGDGKKQPGGNGGKRKKDDGQDSPGGGGGAGAKKQDSEAGKEDGGDGAPGAPESPVENEGGTEPGDEGPGEPAGGSGESQQDRPSEGSGGGADASKAKEDPTKAGGKSLKELLEEAIKKMAGQERQKEDAPKCMYDFDLPPPTIISGMDSVFDIEARGSITRKQLVQQAQVENLASGVRQQMQQIVRSQNSIGWNRELSRGQIDPSRLAALATKTSFKVFKRRTMTEAPHAAVCIIIDGSSSMNEKYDGTMRIQTAQQGAIALAESLESLGIATEVVVFQTIGFGSSTNDAEAIAGASDQVDNHGADKVMRVLGVRHARYKSYGETLQAAAPKLSLGMRGHGGTPLAESLQLAGLGLRARKEPRKIIMALTDGAPCGPRKWVSNAIAKLEREGIVTGLIGIMTHGVTDLTKRHAVINDVTELPKAMISLTTEMLR